MHHADHSGVYQPRTVGKMHECSPGELIARAALMHHDGKGLGASLCYAALKGLTLCSLTATYTSGTAACLRADTTVHA